MLSQVLQQLCNELQQQSSLFADTAPGWSMVLEHVQEAASLGPLTAQPEASASASPAVPGSAFSSLEAAISGLLIWAQHACDPASPAPSEGVTVLQPLENFILSSAGTGSIQAASDSTSDMSIAITEIMSESGFSMDIDLPPRCRASLSSHYLAKVIQGPTSFSQAMSTDCPRTFALQCRP